MKLNANDLDGGRPRADEAVTLTDAATVRRSGPDPERTKRGDLVGWHL